MSTIYSGSMDAGYRPSTAGRSATIPVCCCCAMGSGDQLFRRVADCFIDQRRPDRVVDKPAWSR